MPRIRYLKSWDFTLYEDNKERSYDGANSESDDEENSGESESPISGNSWLSNAAVIANIPDAKIKQAIISLKSQLRQLEAELLSRRLADRRGSRKNWNEIGSARGKTHEPRVDGESLGRNVRRRNKGNIRLQGLASLRHTLKKLGIKDVDNLIKEWNKIVVESKERKNDET
jgi:hypothetical protein